MKKIMTFLLLSALTMPSCWAVRDGHKIVEIVDPYNGDRTLAILNIPTDSCSGDPSTIGHDQVSLTFGLLSSKDGTIHFFIAAKTMTIEPFRVPEKGTIDTLIDGTPKVFIAPVQGKIEVYRGPQFGRQELLFWETDTYDATLDDISRIAAAKTFQFRINGDHSTQRCASAKHLASINEFLVRANLIEHKSLSQP